MSLGFPRIKSRALSNIDNVTLHSPSKLLGAAVPLLPELDDSTTERQSPARVSAEAWLDEKVAMFLSHHAARKRLVQSSDWSISDMLQLETAFHRIPSLCSPILDLLNSPSLAPSLRDLVASGVLFDPSPYKGSVLIPSSLEDVKPKHSDPASGQIYLRILRLSAKVARPIVKDFVLQNPAERARCTPLMTALANIPDDVLVSIMYAGMTIAGEAIERLLSTLANPTGSKIANFGRIVSEGWNAYIIKRRRRFVLLTRDEQNTLYCSIHLLEIENAP